MIPEDPAPPVTFRELTFEQAQQHLDAYLAVMPERIDALRADMPGRGGPSAAELDGSPGSLDRLWNWYRSTEKPTGQAWTRDAPNLPIWALHLPEGRHQGWSAALLQDLDRISGYAGQVIVAADDTARWQVMVPPKGTRGKWNGHHEPVIVSRRVGIRNPRSQIGVLIGRMLDPSANPKSVRERMRLLLPPGIPDDPPVQEPVEGDWTVDGLHIEASRSREEMFDVRVWVDEFAKMVAGDDAFRELASRVAAVDGIDEAVHVDTEELFLRTKLPYPEIERIVRDALRTDATR